MLMAPGAAFVTAMPFPVPWMKLFATRQPPEELKNDNPPLAPLMRLARITAPFSMVSVIAMLLPPHASVLPRITTPLDARFRLRSMPLLLSGIVQALLSNTRLLQLPPFTKRTEAAEPPTVTWL